MGGGESGVFTGTHTTRAGLWDRASAPHELQAAGGAVGTVPSSHRTGRDSGADCVQSQLRQPLHLSPVPCLFQGTQAITLNTAKRSPLPRELIYLKGILGTNAPHKKKSIPTPAPHDLDLCL